MFVCNERRAGYPSKACRMPALVWEDSQGCNLYKQMSSVPLTAQPMWTYGCVVPDMSPYIMSPGQATVCPRLCWPNNPLHQSNANGLPWKSFSTQDMFYKVICLTTRLHMTLSMLDVCGRHTMPCPAVFLWPEPNAHTTLGAQSTKPQITNPILISNCRALSHQVAGMGFMHLRTGVLG